LRTGIHDAALQNLAQSLACRRCALGYAHPETAASLARRWDALWFGSAAKTLSSLPIRPHWVPRKLPAR
jgi:hypothetical protein